MSHSPDSYLLHTPSIFVDDSDPPIQYSGTWSAANETDIMSLVFDERTPMLNTLHVVPILNKGSFSYNFTGVGVSVFATPVDNSTFISQCLLDGLPLTPNPNTENTKFGQSRPVCEAFGLPNNTAHTISVTVSAPPQDHQGFKRLCLDLDLITCSFNRKPAYHSGRVGVTIYSYPSYPRCYCGVSKPTAKLFAHPINTTIPYNPKICTGGLSVQLYGGVSAVDYCVQVTDISSDIQACRPWRYHRRYWRKGDISTHCRVRNIRSNPLEAAKRAVNADGDREYDSGASAISGALCKLEPRRARTPTSSPEAEGR
ncbi:hypothetical protein D9619_013647 [Psilocybe cf. subviscida]|uniref:Ubiquitin 3 binding protein But2 C-terminal domain-containing protein n=1 Tax=Psilocybe cf. subviscida TaxID=2480587 RepID=A0A8H5BRM4_9AGAR|nr:hypothetical protein D9619_013647 [Psilocybe cf. subviscida]